MAALIAKSLPIKISFKLTNVKVLNSSVVCNRQLWLGQTFYGNNQMAKQGKLLRKIMVGGSRKNWYKDPIRVMEKPQPGSSNFLKPNNTRVNRRVSVLNSVLMHNICDIIATGELEAQLIGLGLEITRVKVNNEFICVNVYWMTSIAENSVAIEQLLHANAGKLRGILSSLRVLGNIPHVIFVKDRYLQNMKDVEYALARADFGPDFEPTDRTHQMRSTVVLKQTIPDLPELRIDEDRDADRTSLKFESLVSTSTVVPQHMRMDIFGLNRQQMLTNVVQKMNAAKATHRTSETGVPTIPPFDETERIEEFGSEVVKRKWPSLPDPTEELRKILRRSQREKQRDHSKDEVKRLLTEEIRSASEPVLGQNFEELYDEEDYYEEEEFERDK